MRLLGDGMTERWWHPGMRIIAARIERSLAEAEIDRGDRQRPAIAAGAFAGCGHGGEEPDGPRGHFSGLAHFGIIATIRRYTVGASVKPPATRLSRYFSATGCNPARQRAISNSPG